MKGLRWSSFRESENVFGDCRWWFTDEGELLGGFLGNTGRGLVGSLNNCYFIIARGVSLIDNLFCYQKCRFSFGFGGRLQG